MEKDTNATENAIESLRTFFNEQHNILVCTANVTGEPSAAIMGTPRIAENGNVEFEISDPISMTLQNMNENKAILFMAYIPGKRARDYQGARIYAEVTEIQTNGEKIERIRNAIRERHGEEKASELIATVTCRIKKVRPVVDRGQQWNEPPFGVV